MAAEAYLKRIGRLKKLVEEKGLDIVVVERGSDVFYFTGYRGAGYLLATPREAVLAVPVLEYLHAADYLSESGLDKHVELVVFKPYGLPGKLVAEESARVIEGGLKSVITGFSAKGEGEARCGVDTVSLPLYEQVSRVCRDVVSVRSIVDEMRLVKEPWEIERIEQAARIAEQALQAALNSLDYGVSEADVAATIESTIRRRGGEGPSFPPIVAFGLNTVYPHAVPSTSRVLVKPTPVLIDLGAVYKGYCSDMTRTLFFDGSPAEFRHTAEAVYEALQAALEKAGPGVTTGELDAAARDILARYGLDKYFIHSLGHGVGIDIHEPPRVTYSDKTVLKPGMVITIEPGVYIPGRHGVRIEELVEITPGGARRITRLEAWLWR